LFLTFFPADSTNITRNNSTTILPKNYSLENATLTTDKSVYGLNEAVRILLTAPASTLYRLIVESPDGVFYEGIASQKDDGFYYEFKPRVAGNYIVNVELSPNDSVESLSSSFEVEEIDTYENEVDLSTLLPPDAFDIELYREMDGDPMEELIQGDAVIGEPVSWSLKAGSMIIKYKTPAPSMMEEEILEEDGIWKKKIIILNGASVEYLNVTAFAYCYLGHGASVLDITLFIIENDSRVDVTKHPSYNVTFTKVDEDSRLYEIRWNIPQLSRKTFEIEYLDYRSNEIENINVSGKIPNKALKIAAAKEYFSLDEKPEFIIEYTSLKGGESVKTFIYDSKGELSDIEAEIEELRPGKSRLN